MAFCFLIQDLSLCSQQDPAAVRVEESRLSCARSCGDLPGRLQPP